MTADEKSTVEKTPRSIVTMMENMSRARAAQPQVQFVLTCCTHPGWRGLLCCAPRKGLRHRLLNGAHIGASNYTAGFAILGARWTMCKRDTLHKVMQRHCTTLLSQMHMLQVVVILIVRPLADTSVVKDNHRIPLYTRCPNDRLRRDLPHPRPILLLRTPF